MDRLKTFLILIFLIILAFAILVGGTMPYFLLYIFMLIFLLPLLHSLIILKGIKGVVIIPEDSLFSGEKLDIEYKLQNKSFLPVTYMEIYSDISKVLSGIDSPKIILSLNSKGSFAKKETITLKRRGYYLLGEIEITIRDIFGFFSFKKKIRNKTSLLVYPDPINLSTFKITTSHQSGEALVRNSVYQDKNRVNSLREYKEGDSVKSIHWKLTAKRDIPIVKDFESHGDTYATILIDNYVNLFKNDIDRHLEDKAANIALGIIDYCLNQNIEVSLETQNIKRYIKIQGQGKSDLKPFLEVLAKFKGNGFVDLKSLIMPRIEIFKKGSTIIIITPNLDIENGTLGIQLKMSNFNPLFIVVTDMENKTGYIDQTVEKMLKEEGIPVYILDHNTSIKETLEVYNG